jgi:hypothetical protein
MVKDLSWINKSNLAIIRKKVPVLYTKTEADPCTLTIGMQ